jgi:PAS domain S-box-containing protein
MDGKIRILHVDDNVHDRKLVRDVLEKENRGFEIIEADRRDKFIKCLKEDKFDLVLSDFNILGFDGLQVIQVVKETDPNLPVIIITGTGSEEIAIQAMKSGAADYVIKSVKHIQGLAPTIKTVLELKRNKEEQRKTEEALRQVENKYQKLLESMMDGFAFVNMSGFITNCNMAFQEMLGYTLPELQKLRYTEITPQKWSSLESKIVSEQVIQKGYSEVYEKEYIRKDGTIFPVEIRTFLYRNDLGEDEGMWCIVRDITLRKHNEEILIESEANFRDLFEYSPIGKSMTGLDGSLKVNKAFCNMLGYTKEELYQKKWQDITFHEDIPESDALSQSLLKGEVSAAHFEKRFIHKKGHIVWTDISVYLRRDKENRPKFFITNISDITERKKADAIIRNNEARFRSYFELSIAGIAITSPKMKWIEVNEYLCAMLGYTREELVSLTWSELTHPDDINLDLENFNRVMKGEIDGYTIDKRFIHKVGRTVWTSLSVKCIRQTNGQVDYFMALLFDISARKLAEESLQKTSLELRLIIRNMLNAFIIWESVFDEHGNYVSFRFGFFNEAYARIAKVKQEEVEGRDVFDVWPETEQSWVEVYGKVATTGIPQTFEMYHKPTRGWYHCNAYRPSDSSRMICVFFEDITERKQMEEKLAWEQYLIHTLLDNIPDYIYFKDLESRFIRINKALANVFGIEDPIMALGKSDFDFFKTEHSQEAFNDEQKIIQTGVPIIGKEEMEVWFDRPSTWVSTTKMPLRNTKGETIGTFGISRDITEMKKIRDDLLKAKEMAEESDRLKTAFLHNISHEIRTPLNAIIGFSSIIGNSELPAEKRREFMNIINVSNDQLLSIISGILALATLDAGQEQVLEKETDINELLRSVYDQFSINLSNSEVVLSYHPELPDESSIIYTDSVKLMQILINLIGNALKFTHKGYVRFGYRIVDDTIQFFVEDSGIGIPEDAHDLIFERFRQADNSSTRKYGGTGLGLALSKGYAELLGGNIELFSKPGQGSIFTIKLPYKPVIRRILSEEISEVNPLAGITSDKLILIAEDDTGNFMLVEQILQSERIKVIRVSNGLEAIDICTGEYAPDMVLMDIKMPILDGIEATKTIKMSRPDLPILALTAYVSEIDKELIFESGCDGLIEKPIRKKELYDTLLRYL